MFQAVLTTWSSWRELDRQEWARRILWISYWMLVLEQVPVYLVSAVLLLLFLPGLLQRSWMNAIWLCFVMLGYFMVNITHLFRLDRSALDVLELFTILTVFISGMLFARWKRHQGQT